MYRAPTERTHRLLCFWPLTSEEVHSTRQRSSCLHQLVLPQILRSHAPLGLLKLQLSGPWVSRLSLCSELLLPLRVRISQSERKKPTATEREVLLKRCCSFQASYGGISGCELSWCVLRWCLRVSALLVCLFTPQMETTWFLYISFWVLKHESFLLVLVKYNLSSIKYIYYSSLGGII